VGRIISAHLLSDQLQQVQLPAVPVPGLRYQRLFATVGQEKGGFSSASSVTLWPHGYQVWERKAEK
jgi:hypothetical protein